jgi:hypothetical protein
MPERRRRGEHRLAVLARMKGAASTATCRPQKITMRPWAAGALAVATLCSDKASGQSAVSAPQIQLTNDDLSKESENPVSRVITLPLRYEADFLDGPYHATKNTFELDQAILPFSLNDDWALITRTKFPAYSQPPKKLGDSWAAGLGNGYTTFFLSPARGEGFYWGVGPVLYYPSATNTALGVNKWGSGPSVAFISKNGSTPWVFGAVINNIWSFGGPPQSNDRTNSLLTNPFISYHFGDGWSIGSSPNITANWLSKAGQVWTVPVGGGISKTVRLGGQPVKLEVDSYYNVIRPQAGDQTWLLQLTLTFLFPT